MTKRLDKLQQKKKQLDAQIQKLHAAEKARQRKQETRRKFLVGAYYLQKARDEETMEILTKQMDSYLTRKIDRVLFDLKPLDECPQEESKIEATIKQMEVVEN